MKIFYTASEDIGEQKGSLRPHTSTKHPLRSALPFLLLAFLMPAVSSAAGFNYLQQNAPQFIDKTKSDYGEMVNIASMLHDYDKKMILAVIVIESEGNEVAKSGRGAQGLMQLMPETAKAMGAKDSNDPFQNILAGTKYLKQLQNVYGFDTPQEALVAYNMGPTRAKRWLSQYSAMDYGYVAKVMYVYGVLQDQEKAQKRLADSIKTNMDEQIKLSSAPAPLINKPRTLSLAAFPMTIPTTRKQDLETN